MPGPLALLLVPVVALLLGLLAPGYPYALTPRPWRPRLYLDRDGWRYGGLLAVLVLCAAFVGGREVDGEGSPSRLGAAMALVLGVPAALATLRAWRVSREVAAARLAAPGPDVPVGATPAHLARVPTPAPAPLVAVVRGRYAVDRGVRRARAACVVVAAVTYTAGRAWQLRDPSRDVPTPLALAILLSLLGALLLPAVLRLLGRHAPLRHPLPADATVTRNDTGRLGDRFPHVPLVRTGPRGGRVQTLSVDGRAGDRLWWATVQKGNTYDRSGVPSRRYRTTCWVWLPGGDLPCVSVCGRDLAPVAEWFGEGLPLESWEFNEAFLVRAAAEDRRAAVALLTPRLMELLGTHLPDGAQLGVVADVLFVVVERCVREDELAPVVSFVLAAADLLPRYLLAPEGARPPG